MKTPGSNRDPKGKMTVTRQDYGSIREGNLFETWERPALKGSGGESTQATLQKTAQTAAVIVWGQKT